MRMAWMAAALIGIMILGAPASASAQDYVLVVNADNPVTTLNKRDVAAIFLKQTTRWSDDKPVVPVDQAKGAKLRDVFMKAVVGKSAAAMDAYWQTQIFSGKNVPPMTRAKDADVLAVVRANANAIGYVDAKTPLPQGVKVVTVK